MGFTMMLLLAYLMLLIADLAALKNRKWILFAAITLFMALGIVLLGYLWISSPM